MISSSTRVRVHETIFKYEVALEERQTLQQAAWSNINCPNGQVRGSASPASRIRRDGLRSPFFVVASASGFVWPRPCRLVEPDSEGEFLRRETGDWG